MSSGVQDASIGGFLQYVEEKGLKAYTSLTGLGCGSKGLSHCLRHEMNLLYRKTKVEWKQRDEEPKKRSGSKLMEMSKSLVPQSG